MYSILILVFFILLSSILASIAIGFCLSKNEQTNDENSYGNENSFKSSRLMFPQSLFVQACIFLIFVSEILLLMPFAIAFSKLGIFVFIEVGIFLFIMLISVGYVIQKNMLRTK